MSKGEPIFSPILPGAMERAMGLGEYAVRALVPWKDGPVWADVILDREELTPEQLLAVNGELQWLWDHFELVEAQFGEGSELLREKNENLFEGEEPMAPEEFRQQMLLEAIQVKLDENRVESLQLWYDDGEMFGGASVLLEWKGRKLTGIEIRD